MRTSFASGWAGDLRFASRQLIKRPGHAAAIVGVLAMTIGANAAVSALVRGVLLRPLPFDAARVVFVWNTNARGERVPLAPARAIDLRDRSGQFSGGALIGHLPLSLTGEGTPDQWPGASVSRNFFDVLGSQAAVGRTFSARDAPVDSVVLSDRLWAERWHRDPAIVGRSIVLNGRPRLVRGVMGADFYWPLTVPEPTALNPPLAWVSAIQADVPEQPIPYTVNPALDREADNFRLVARLRPGVSVAAANAALKITAAALARDYPASDASQGAVVTDARTQLFGSVERPMLFIWLASAVVVVGACLNVCTLLYVRQASRRREFAVRSALGADRMRLARQLTSETTLLSLAGGAAGLVFARAILGLLVSRAPEGVGRLEGVSIDVAVAGFTMASAAVIGAFLGVFSALSLWRDRSADSLRGAGVGDRTHVGLRKILVGAEAALALVLMIATALFGASLLRLQRVDVGFDTRNLLTFTITRDPAPGADARRDIQFFGRMLERVRAVPGVKHASAAVTLPIGGDDFGGSLFVEGRPLPPPGTARRLGFQVVAQGWFETLGMRILDGRDFSADDTSDAAPVLVVNKTFAEQEWPGQRAIGQRVRRSRNPKAPLATVIGVVSDIRHGGPSSPPRPEFYLPFAQSPFSFMAFAVRTEGPPAGFTPAIRAAVADVDPAVPAAEVSTMEQYVMRAYGRARFLSTLTIAFGALALGLTLVGVYGVTSFSVAQRTREFGVRTALGASGLQLVRGIVRDDMVPVSAGVVIGVGIAIAASKAVQGLLFDTPPLDAPAYVTATLVLLSTASVAMLIPARRAVRIDPMTALRDA